MTYTIPERAAAMLPWLPREQRAVLLAARLDAPRRPDSFKLQPPLPEVTYWDLCDRGLMEDNAGTFTLFLSPLGIEVRRLLRRST